MYSYLCCTGRYNTCYCIIVGILCQLLPAVLITWLSTEIRRRAASRYTFFWRREFNHSLITTEKTLPLFLSIVSGRWLNELINEWNREYKRERSEERKKKKERITIITVGHGSVVSSF